VNNNLAIKTTLENKILWESSGYKDFLKYCSKEEFLQSQTPFYYAVESFPLMLIILASKIKSSKERLLVIENIWEEHGNGDVNNFHTETFKQHLESLGMEKNYLDDKISSENPYVEEWISSVLNSDMSLESLGSYLSGVEYIYAVISEDIALFIDTIELEKESVHYQKHSKLDWSHGQELLDVVRNCDLKIDNDTFINGQKDLINLFSKLACPTEVKLKKVSLNPVSFFYSREDSGTELFALNSIKKKNVNIFSICSGGEHILKYLSDSDKTLSIDLFDINESQISVFKNKLLNIEQEVTGKFESLFCEFRKLLPGEGLIEKRDLLANKDKIKYATSVVFSRRNLNIVFSDSATKYTVKDFSEHFYNAFIESLEKDHINALNVFYGLPFCHDNSFKFDVKKTYNEINYIVSDMSGYAFVRDYDLIDLSNIGDWMELSDYQVIVDKAYKALANNGQLIVRKLLGDYSLKDTLDSFDCVLSFDDKTKFYTECYIAIKR
jgi:hypothetical protein